VGRCAISPFDLITAMYDKTPIWFIGGAAMEIPSSWGVLSTIHKYLPVPLDLIGMLSVLGNYVIKPTDIVIFDNELSMYPHYSMNNACQFIMKNPKRVSLEILLGNEGNTTILGGLNTPVTTDILNAINGDFAVNNIECFLVLTKFQKLLEDHRAKSGWFSIVTRAGIFENMQLNGSVVLEINEHGLITKIKMNFIEIITSISDFETSANEKINRILGKVPFLSGVY
jgi:hypothetical protein